VTATGAVPCEGTLGVHEEPPSDALSSARSLAERRLQRVVLERDAAAGGRTRASARPPLPLARKGQPAEVSYDCVMSETGAELSRVLDEVVRRIVGVAHPDRIILFGSAARGETGPDSDIDLLVIKQGVAHRGQLAGQIHRALVGVAVAVDVVVATPEDVEYLRDKVGSIMGPALREGREIYAP